MSSKAMTGVRAGIVVVAPVVLLLGFVYHPYVANATDDAALAEAAASDTTRWGVAHLAIGVGYALLALAFVALRAFLREAADERWTERALPFAVLGSALFPILTGMEFALLAAAETGGDIESVQSELTPWFIPILVTAAISFTVGAIGFAIGIRQSRVLGTQLTWFVVGGLVVASVARFVPLGAAQIVIGLALTLAFWPLAYAMWMSPSADATERRVA